MRIGVRFQPGWPPEDLLAFACSVEEQGYDELWFSEDCFWSGGVAMAATALAATSRLAAGVGLFPATTRNPATAAMELGALARMFPGRLVTAFGRGVPGWMNQIGAATPRPLAHLEDTVSAVRSLLHGEEVSASTAHLQLQQVRLGFPPVEPPPVLIGTTGSKGFGVAARAADGVVLAEVSTPRAVQWARRELEQTGRVGRIVVFALLSLDHDSAAAVATIAQDVATWARSGVFTQITSVVGIDDTNDGPLDDSLVRMMTVSGDADDCIASLSRWESSGVDTLVLIPRSGDGREQVARFGAEVLPRMHR